MSLRSALEEEEEEDWKTRVVFVSATSVVQANRDDGTKLENENTDRKYLVVNAFRFSNLSYEIAIFTKILANFSTKRFEIFSRDSTIETGTIYR